MPTPPESSAPGVPAPARATDLGTVLAEAVLEIEAPKEFAAYQRGWGEARDAIAEAIRTHPAVAAAQAAVEALKFYADETTWQFSDRSVIPPMMPAFSDCGKRARAALPQPEPRK